MASSAKEISDLAHGIDVDASGNISLGVGSNLNLDSNLGANSTTAFTSMDGRIFFSNDYSNTPLGANKIVLQNDGTWNSGFGISNNSLDIYTGGDINFHKSNSTSSWTRNITFKGDGKVGIGTIAPADKMHIYNDSGTTVFRADVNSNSTVGFEINKTGSTTQSWKIADGITHNGALQFYDGTNSAVRMHINGTGNVGIGVTAPQFKLHVNKGSGNWAPTNGVIENIAGFQTNYDSVGSQILTYANLDGNWVDGTSGANSASGWLWGYQNNVRGGLVYDHRGTERMQLFSSYGALTLMTPDSADGNGVPTDSNMNERLTILPGGNVGIGTTTPSVRLHVVGGSDANLYLKSDSSRSGAFLMKPGTDTVMGSLLQLSDESYRLGTASNYHIQMNQDGKTILNATGNSVGIGSANPTGQLDISSIPAVAYSAGSFNTRPAITIKPANANTNYGAIRFTNTSGNFEHFFGSVQTSSNTADMVFQGYDRTGGSYKEYLRLKDNGNIEMIGNIFHREVGNQGDMTFPICSISNSSSGNQYLHAQFQLHGGAMFHIHFFGYDYNATIRSGSGGGYIYNTAGQATAYSRAFSGHCVEVYQNIQNRVELVINTGSGGTGNRWGSMVFFGGTDTITSDCPISLVQYTWNGSTARQY